MDVDNKIPGFRHKPLPDPKRYIRLLEVLSLHGDPAIDGAEIICRLRIRRFKDKPRYHAISYTWGDANDTTYMLVNGRRMEIRRNCHYVLKQATWHGGSRYIWCDAICINQTDDDEKGHQVAMMGNIYRHASGVLACVGEHADDSKTLFQALCDESSLLNDIAASATTENYEDTYEEEEEDPPWARRARTWALREDKRMASLVRCIKTFLHRQYFSRTWIYQELVLGRRIVLCCGRSYAPLYTLYGAFAAMRYMGYLGGRLAPQVRPLLRAGAFSWSRAERRSLSKLMMDVLPLQCHDPRDKVYAVLSLVDWGHETPIYPSYTRDALDLAAEVVTRYSWMQRDVSQIWEHLPTISSLLRLNDPSQGLARAVQLRRQRFLDSLSTNQVSSRDKRLWKRKPGFKVRFRAVGLTLERGGDGWYFKAQYDCNQRVDIQRWPLDHRVPIDIHHSRNARDALLLPEVAEPGDLCLFIHIWDEREVEQPLVLVARQHPSTQFRMQKQFEIIGKGLLWGRDFFENLYDCPTFAVCLGAEDILVLFNTPPPRFYGFSSVLGDEIDDYLRTGVCGNVKSSFAVPSARDPRPDDSEEESPERKEVTYPGLNPFAMTIMKSISEW